MFKLIVIIILLFNQVAVAENRLVIDKNDKLDFKCAAVIKEDNAKFYFIDEAKHYQQGLKWNKETLSAIEYSWIVYLDMEYETQGNVYEGIDIGVRYYSKNADRETGSLARLVNHSEVKIFGYSNDSFMPIRIAQDNLNANIENGDLVLTVIRAEDTSHVFDSVTDNAHFWVIADGAYPRKCLTMVRSEK